MAKPIKIFDRDEKVLALRSKGLKFKEIGDLLFNEITEKHGVSESRARQAYYEAIKRAKHAEEKKKKDRVLSSLAVYVQEVCEVIEKNTILIK